MTTAPTYRRVAARPTAHLTAVLSSMRALGLRETTPDAGLPDHVRAASAIRRLGERLVILQDDVNALAVLATDRDQAELLLLPAGHGGARVFDDARGNKKFKMDLEACATLPDDRLVAFGSGSSRRRERLVVLEATDEAPRVVDAAPLYGELRALAASHGAELNVEGALVQGPTLWLVQRGHGKRPTTQWNAFLALDLDGFCRWLRNAANVPAVVSIVELDVGTSNAGVLYGLTDATVASDGRFAFVACAEDSADVRSDGPVQGCRFGLLDERTGEAVVTDVCDAAGRPTTLKLEGIERRPGRDDTYDVVADVDRPEAPALLAQLRVSERADPVGT